MKRTDSKKFPDSRWTALVGLTGLHFMKMHGPNSSLEKQILRGQRMLIILRPLKCNLDHVCEEVNLISAKSKQLGLLALDRAIELELLEIIGFDTGDKSVDEKVSRRVEDLFGLVF